MELLHSKAVYQILGIKQHKGRCFLQAKHLAGTKTQKTRPGTYLWQDEGETYICSTALLFSWKYQIFYLAVLMQIMHSCARHPNCQAENAI